MTTMVDLTSTILERKNNYVFNKYQLRYLLSTKYITITIAKLLPSIIALNTTFLGPRAASPPSYVPSPCYSLCFIAALLTTVLGLIHQSPHYHCYPWAASLPAPSSSAQFSAIATLLSSGCLSASVNWKRRDRRYENNIILLINKY